MFKNMIYKTKSFYFMLLFILLLLISSNILAENNDYNIYGLGYTKVENAKYLDNEIFSFELRKSEQNNNHPREKLFRGSKTLRFTFNPNEVDGIIVLIKIHNEKTFREDIKLSGKSFVNLLLKKVKNSESLNLTCGIRQQPMSKESEIKTFELTYFQVNDK